MDDWSEILSALPRPSLPTRTERNVFTKRIIDTFKEQRQSQQFAAIVYCTQDDLDSGLRSVDFCIWDDYDYPLLDSDIPCVPEYTWNITNYLAARPSGRIHAERTLMRHLDRLSSAFINEYEEPPEHIYLYTWFTPCTQCSVHSTL